MLRLSRKTGQSIVIDEQTIIHVLKTGPGRCEIGVEAPQHLNVRRSELPVQTEEIINRIATELRVAR
jgi:carbon storage regulator CsrA